MLYPMFTLVMLSYVVLLITVRVRMGAVREGAVPISYFSLMQGQDVPEMVAKTSRQLSNLFEMPVLFYVGGLLYIALDMTGTFPIVCLGVCRDPHCTYLYSSRLQQCAAPPVGVWIRQFMHAGDVDLNSVGGAITDIRFVAMVTTIRLNQSIVSKKWSNPCQM